MMVVRQGLATERVFLYHVRRAGGTSLRDYCQRFAATEGLQYEVSEGYSLDYGRYFERSPATLHVICLRDPVERIKSSFRFEGRWKQRERLRTRENAKPFSRWVDENRCNGGRTTKLWVCTENYYVKALIGYPRVGAGHVGPAEIELAKRRLEEFELVLVTEWLSRPETATYLRRKLRFDMSVPHRRFPELESPQMTEELFDAATLAQLREANRLDQELYEYARELFQRRMALSTPAWNARTSPGKSRQSRSTEPTDYGGCLSRRERPDRMRRAERRGAARHKVLGYGWPFSPRWSSNSTRRPRLFDWTDNPTEATVDVAVYLSAAIQDGVDQPGRKIAWVLESPEIARWQRTTLFIEQNLEKVVSSYEVVLTSDRSFCTLHPKIVYHPAAANLPWIREEQYAIYKKDKLCSMFASKKKMVAAHRYRHHVAEGLKDKLDLFGGACGSPRIGGDGVHPDKSEGMIPYMFQVVMENAKVDFYYTEKITDCFATGTVPIYWGSDCIGELFDTEGIIRFDDDFDIDALSEELYYRMMPAIRNNFRLVQQLEGTDDLLYRKYIRAPVPGEQISPWRPGASLLRESGSVAEEPDEAPPPLKKGGQGGFDPMNPPQSPCSKGGSVVVPWQPWDPQRVLASTQAVHASQEERLRIVTDAPKRTVRTLTEVLPECVTVREVTSTMQPPQCVRSFELASWPPQLTKAFLLHLSDAFIGDNVVFDSERYFSMGRWWLGHEWRDYMRTREVRHVDAGVSIGAWGGEAFQHFVFDALPPLAAVIDLLETPALAHVRIVSHNEEGRAAQWFWNRLGLADRIVAKPRNVSSGFVVHADLVLFPQFEPNLNQLGLYPRSSLRPIQQRLGTLEAVDRVLVVYLRRSSARSVANEDALLSAVRKVIEGSGLELHVFRGGGGPGAAEDLMKRARIVLGPHGGAFGNLIFAQPGTHVIEFVPLRRLIAENAEDPLTMYYGLSQAAGLDYWFVEPDRFDLEQPGMVVDVDEVAEVISRVLEDTD